MPPLGSESDLWALVFSDWMAGVAFPSGAQEVNAMDPLHLLLQPLYEKDFKGKLHRHFLAVLLSSPSTHVPFRVKGDLAQRLERMIMLYSEGFFLIGGMLS